MSYSPASLLRPQILLISLKCMHPGRTKDKRPSYEEWSAEFKRVKREQERKAMEAAIEEEEIASGCCKYSTPSRQSVVSNTFSNHLIRGTSGQA